MASVTKSVRAIPFSFNLNRYGKDFPKYLKQMPEMAQFPYLSALAEYCYCWRQVYCDAKIPGMQIISEYPVHELWLRCQPEFSAESSNFVPRPGPFNYVLAREQGKVRVLELYALSEC